MSRSLEKVTKSTVICLQVAKLCLRVLIRLTPQFLTQKCLLNAKM